MTYLALSDAAEAPAFWQVGCLEVATTEKRMTQAHQDVEHGRQLGIGARVLDAAEAASRCPLPLADARTGAGGGPRSPRRRTGWCGGRVATGDRVVLATGIWGPALAATAGVRLPMVDVQHPYLFTAERPELDDTPIDAPIVRYPDHTVYTRCHGRRCGLGSRGASTTGATAR